jgi:very-short-patch-repair endonuclease
MGRPKGSKQSDEAKRKISEGNKRAWKLHPRKLSKKARAKIASTLKRRYATDLVHPMTGHKHSVKMKKHWSKIRKGRKTSEKTKAKQRSTLKRVWSTGVLQKQVSERLKKRFAEGGPAFLQRARAVRALYLKKPIPQETTILVCLKQKRIRCEPQKIFLGRYSVDIYVPRFDLIIECDRRVPSSKNAKQQKRDKDLLSVVHHIVHLSYKEIESNPKAAVEKALLHACK